MSDPGNILFVNRSPLDQIVLVPAVYGCIDNLVAWERWPAIIPGSSLGITVFRTDGHGCNGERGVFDLMLSSDFCKREIKTWITGDGEIEFGWVPLPDEHYNFPACGYREGKKSESCNKIVVMYSPNPFYGPAPNFWRNPRPISGQSEADCINQNLSGQQNSDGIRVFGTNNYDYDCLSWALRKTDGMIHTGSDMGFDETDRLMTQWGIDRVDNIEDANIIGWGYEATKSIKHFSKYSFHPDVGFSWSSKLGTGRVGSESNLGLLVTHERDAPEAYGDGGYGLAQKLYRSKYEVSPNEI